MLRLGADSYKRNELTVKQIDDLEQISKIHEDVHKRSIQTADDVVDMRNAFNRGFKGILKLEIVKKRRLFL